MAPSPSRPFLCLLSQQQPVGGGAGGVAVSMLGGDRHFDVLLSPGVGKLCGRWATKGSKNVTEGPQQ